MKFLLGFIHHGSLRKKTSQLLQFTRAPEAQTQQAVTKTSKEYLGGTPLKINMEPQNEGLEDVFPFQMGDFQVLC